MKKTAILLLPCLLAVYAFAADMSTSIQKQTSFNGQTLKPGEYRLDYEVKGGTAELKVIRSGKTGATATGQVVELKDAAQYTGVVSEMNPDGSRTVIEIQFANQKSAIHLGPEAGTAGK